jgi:hypothetical protein
MELSEEFQKLDKLEQRLKTMPPGDYAAKCKMVAERVRNALVEIKILQEEACADNPNRAIERRLKYVEVQYSLITRS